MSSVTGAAAQPQKIEKKPIKFSNLLRKDRLCRSASRSKTDNSLRDQSAQV